MIPEHFRTKSSRGKEKVFEIFCLGEGERGGKREDKQQRVMCMPPVNVSLTTNIIRFHLKSPADPAAPLNEGKKRLPKGLSP